MLTQHCASPRSALPSPPPPHSSTTAIPTHHHIDISSPPKVQQPPSPTMHAIEDLKRAFTAVTIDLEASEAEKAALETRISLLKRERRRLEAELTRELAAAGKTPPPTSIMPSLVEAVSSASASDAGPHHGPGPVADTNPWRVDQAACAAADAAVAASKKRKRKAPATAPTSPNGEKPYACSMCPKRFTSKGHVAPHERTHTGEKPYACSMCPRRFAHKNAVPPHERTHTGEKPYACSMCPRRFSDKSQVVPHERTHTGEKPYACSMCPMRFTSKGNVARHERTHTGEMA